ncbi:MAG: hypothetical protein ACR2H3_12005 [Acidimicrobiales bacterium]
MPTPAEEIVEAARARESSADFPAALVGRIRSATARLGATAVRPDDIRHAAVLVERASAIDPQVPAVARAAPLGLAKQVIKKAMFFYIRFLADQISLLGHAAARMGFSVAERIDSLDEEIAALRSRVEALEAAADPTGETK